MSLGTLEDRITPAAPYLVADINTVPIQSNSDPLNLVAVDGFLYFTAGDLQHGIELWKSDGTQSGTVVVKDINASGSSFPGNLTNVNGTLYFSANDGINGIELWKSDGTETGTVLIKDISVDPYGYGGSPSNLASINGTLYFTANDGVNGRELWKSDGTEVGTVLLKDINASGFSNPRNLTNVNGTLFFAANDGVNGYELWKSDGSETGTVLVKDINPGSYPYGGGGRSSMAYGTELTNVNGTLFFTANDGVNGRELWKSDGSDAGTVAVKDINPSGSSFPGNLTNVNGTLYFAANDGISGMELWTSDGSEPGTELVKDILPGFNSSYLNQLTNVNGTLFFDASDGSNGRELWQSDGTEGGTALVKDISPGSNGSYPYELTDVSGTLFFTANDGINGTELWKSDGTEVGTVLVKDIRPGSSYPSSAFPRFLTDVNGTLFFTADNGVNGRGLWKSDGTEPSTVLFDIDTGKTNSSYPSEMTEVNGTVLFVAGEDVHGTELWKTDGTEAGTALFKDINPGLDGSFDYPFIDLINVNGTLFFAANDGVHGMELWKSDGTEEGTVLVKDINPGGSSFPASYYGSDPHFLTEVNGKLFFVANDGITGAELWTSDGTEAGTILVKDIGPETFFPSYPQLLTEVNGTLFFAADDGVNGYELWRSDGTEAGTVLVKDINSGPSPYGSALSSMGYGTEMANVNGTLFFTANDGINGIELWKSDGTEEGTVLVKDITPGLYGSYGPQDLTNVNGTLFFGADDGVNGKELWKSDGTEAGTVLVKDIDGSPYGSQPFQLTDVDGTLFMIAHDYNGYELWKSDGTEAGTVLVKDITPGPYGSLDYLSELTNVNGTLYFVAGDGIHGSELWKSDGTESGTVMVGETSPGPEYGQPAELSLAGTLLYFSADDGTHGRELWAVEPNDINIDSNVVSENEPIGTLVGTMSALGFEPEVSYTFELVGGKGSDDNGAFVIAGDELRTNAVLNWETKESLTVRIRVTDSGGLTYEKAITITVLDADEAASKVGTLGGTSWAYNALADSLTIVGKTSADSIGIETAGVGTESVLMLRANGQNITFDGLAGRPLIFAHTWNHLQLINVDARGGNDLVRIGTASGSALPVSAYESSELNGDKGNDTLTGGNGPDILHAEAGNDTQDGREGSDTYLASGTEALSDVIVDTGAFGTDTLKNDWTDPLDLKGFNAGNGIEVVDGSGLPVRGDNGANVLDFRAATLVNVRVVDGRDGHDTIYASNLAATNASFEGYFGGEGKDTIYGGNAADKLFGGEGQDLLVGGDGLDTLVGGGGNDTFILGQPSDPPIDDDNNNNGIDDDEEGLPGFVG